MYTIQIKGDTVKAQRLANALQARIDKSGKFRVSEITQGEHHSFRQDYSVVGNIFLPTLILRNIRLTHIRPFCGAHPGECLANPFTGRTPNKPNSSHLEWEDWVAFHQLVNGVLSQRHVWANIWTTPRENLDKGSKMWIRRGLLPRVKWEWEENWSRGFRVQTWNHGDPSQFQR